MQNAQKTTDQIRGLQFEIWCEHLFKQIFYRGYAEVRRDVHYHSGEGYRQVDLEYFNLFSLDEHFVMLEMKYQGSGYLDLKFRGGQKKKKQDQRRSITNVITEIEERRMFVQADTAILVTNQKTTKALQKEADKHEIQVYDGSVLKKLDTIRWFGIPKDLYKQITNVPWKKYEREPHNVRL